MLLWFVLCVSRKDAEVLKMFVFPSFGGFVGWLIFVYLGLEGLGVLVFLVFVSILFEFFLFCFCLLLDCFWCCFCFVHVFPCFFVFAFCFLFFCSFGRFKGQVRWPTRPPQPHLALNPPFLVYCFLFFCFISFFL